MASWLQDEFQGWVNDIGVYGHLNLKPIIASENYDSE